MNTTKKIAIGVAGTAIALAAPLGAVAAANASSTNSTPAASSYQWQGRGMHGQGVGTLNGAGYGASAVADYLADKLGVSADDVTSALRAFHADNPVTTPGRDLSDDALAARQEAEATYLASALDVDVATVQDALESFQSDRQATMTTQLADRLDAMVEAGTLTQDEADAILDAHEAGEPMMLGGGQGGGHGGRWG